MRVNPHRLVTAVRWTALFARIAPLLAGLFSLAQDAQSVTLAWDLDTDPTVVGYRLYYGTSSGSYTQSSDVPNRSTATISNLAVGYTYFFVVRAYNVFGLESQPSNEVSFTPTANPALPASSLFSASDTPANVNWDDPNSVEVGVKFQSTALGKVVGIRFYKGILNTGPHVGSLWSANGELLGQITFTNETDSGWQEADFVEPVLLVPGATYVASYHTNGFYAVTSSYFSGAHINGSLSAPSSGGSAGGNGVYAYGLTSSFPTASFYSTNYWVDVAFTLSTASLFSPSDIPANVIWNDPTPVELGVRFQSAVAGFVTGVRFYKGLQNTGLHVGNLWSSDGTLLASATFTGETASGWQTAAFTNPVPIAPDTIYIVSYHSNGFYSADPDYYASDHTNGPLLAPATGGNGVYARGTTSSFPSVTFGATNYWVDLIFTLQAPGGP